MEVKDALSVWRKIFREAVASVTDLQRFMPCFVVAEESVAVAVKISVGGLP